MAVAMMAIRVILEWMLYASTRLKSSTGKSWAERTIPDCLRFSRVRLRVSLRALARSCSSSSGVPAAGRPRRRGDGGISSEFMPESLGRLYRVVNIPSPLSRAAFSGGSYTAGDKEGGSPRGLPLERKKERGFAPLSLPSRSTLP